TVTIAASSGSFAASSGGNVTVGGSGTTTLTLAGTETDINTYLDTVSNIQYTGALNANGENASTFTVNVDDGTVDPEVGNGNIDITNVAPSLLYPVLNNVDNKTDNATTTLSHAISVTSTEIDGTTYIFVAGRGDNGVTVFSVTNDGTLAYESKVTDSGSLELNGAASVATAIVDETNYLFVAGVYDDGVSVFSIDSDGNLTNEDNVTDDSTLLLDGAQSLTTAVVDGTTYLFVAGSVDNGITIFSVANNGDLTYKNKVADDGSRELDGAYSVTTAVVDDTTYLFAAGFDDDGVSVFSVASDGALTSVEDISDNGTLNLDQANSVRTTVIGGATFLFVTGGIDDGVSVFSVANNGTLTNVDNVSDSGSLELDGAYATTSAVVDGITHLFVAGLSDDGLSVFSVADNGILTNAENIADNGSLELVGAISLTTATVGSKLYLFSAGLIDSGVSVFSIDGLSFTFLEDTPSDFDLSSITVDDQDGDALTLSVSATAGTFVSNSGGNVTIGGSGSATLTLQGSASDINTFLDTVSNIHYTGSENSNGDDASTITLNLDDGTIDLDLKSGTIHLTEVNDDPTGTVSISGTPTEDETLTASNTLADADGIGTISYQWQRDGLDISGATSSTYTLIQADVGATIQVVASYTDDQGTEESVTSSTTTTVANVNDDPTVSGLSTDITFTEDTASNFDLSSLVLADEDGDSLTLTITIDAGSFATPADGSSLSVTETLVDSSTITLEGSAANINTYLDTVPNIQYIGDSNVSGDSAATVTLNADDGSVNPQVGSANIAITAVNDPATGGVSIIGIPALGQTLTGISTISDPDGISDSEYAWLRDGVLIAGSNSLTYTLVEADIGAEISFSLVFTDGLDQIDVATSTTTLPIAANEITDPVDGLFAYWPFDTDYKDLGPNQLHSTPNADSAVSYPYVEADPADGLFNGNLRFAGPSSHLDLDSHAATLNTLTEGSLSVWFRNETPAFENLIWLGNGPNSVSLSIDSENKVAFQVLTAAGNYILYTVTALPTHTWHHIVITVDSDGNKAYLNGRLLTPSELTYDEGDASHSSFFSAITAADDFDIAYSSNYNDGRRLDDFRIYDHALDASDVTTLFEAAPQSLPNPATTFYGGISLNQDSGNNAYLALPTDDTPLDGLARFTLEIQLSQDNFAKHILLSQANATYNNVLTVAQSASDEIAIALNTDDNLLVVAEALGLSTSGENVIDDNFVVIKDSRLDALSDGDFHTLAMTWDNSNGAWAFFLDGNLLDSGSGLLTGQTLSSGGDFVIAQHAITPLKDTALQATLYNLRLFDTIRNASEIATHHYAGEDSSTTGIIANWDFQNLSATGKLADSIAGRVLSIKNHAIEDGFLSSKPQLVMAVPESDLDELRVATIEAIHPVRDELRTALLAANTNLVYDEITQKFYQYLASSTSQTWSQAQSTATTTTLNGISGQLPTSQSAYENKLLAAIASDFSASTIWLGASDEGLEGTWYWYEDGFANELFFSDEFDSNVFANWAITQPDNTSSNEHYAALDASTSEWSDYSAPQTGPATLVEWDANEVLENSSGPDGSLSISYAITSQTPSDVFQIYSSTNILATTESTEINYETLDTHSVTILATDPNGNETSKTFSIKILDRNDFPTGSVSLTGIPTEDQVLTASNDLADEDSIGTINYQWQRDGADIDGATDSSYTLVQADVGANIRVAASYTDDRANEEGPFYSDATAAVANINDDPTGSLSLSGTLTQGQEILATNTLVDEDGLGTITYQWQRNSVDITGATDVAYTLTQDDVGNNIRVTASYTDDEGSAEGPIYSTESAAIVNLNDDPTGIVSISGTLTEDEILTASNTLADVDDLGTISYQWQRDSVDISDAADSSYTLTQADVDSTIRVIASYTDGYGTAESVPSSATAAVANVNDNPTGDVAILGIPTQSETLTASSTLSDEDGLGTISYQWQRDEADISGATHSSYTLTQADVDSNIRVVASYTDDQETEESKTSSSTATVANVNDEPTGVVSISGTPTEDEILTASNTLADEDGLGAIAYQWQRDEADISGATNSSYTLTQADVDSTIQVVANYTDGYGTAESVPSSAAAAVANVNDEPTGLVSISGTSTEDEILTASNTLADEDGLGAISYQWQRDEVDISGATNSSYTLTQADVDSTIQIVASYTDEQGTEESETSSATATVANVNDEPIGLVSISGTPTEDEILTASNTLADEDGLGAISYQWQRDSVDIPGATDSTYNLTQADVGSRIRVVVSYTDDQGTDEGPIYSEETISIANSNNAPVATADTVLRPGVQVIDISISRLLANDTDPDGDTLSLVSIEYTGGNGATLDLQETQITYDPQGFTGVDSFSYTVEDPAGLQASTTVTVGLTINENNPPLVTEIELLNDSLLQITFRGFPGKNYRIDSSSDMEKWSPIGNGTAAENGYFTIEVNLSEETPKKFFRSVKPEAEL
ncbi:Ig-like domain-containing protein, partial [Puniceicoccaceae bacterium K14]|nr:Ig-like domain-containing protein [Puniceicoccaceae bacterium K14]